MACNALAADPSDYRRSVLGSGVVGQPAIVKALSQQVTGEGAPYCPRGIYRITNNLTLAAGQYLEFGPGCDWRISTNIVVTFNMTQFKADNWPHFSGGGMITGTVVALEGCWQMWGSNITANGGVYALTCVEDSGDSRFWETTNNLINGDLHGTLTNAQINTGAVTTVEIMDWTVQTNDVSTNMWQFITNQAAQVALNVSTSSPGTVSGTNYSYAISVYMTRTTFDIPPGWTYTNVPLEGTNFDFSGGSWVSNRFFVPVTGLWYVEGGLYDKTGNLGWDMTAGIATNHTSGIYDLIGIGQFNVTNTPSGDGSSQTSRMYYLTRGTAVSLAAFNGKATAKTIQGTAKIEKPYFGAYLISR